MMNNTRLSRLEVSLVALLLAFVLALSLYHLATYPAPWFDEGWYLQVPRNLLLYGRYAILSSEGFRMDDTVLSVAPTVYFPVALAFRLGGIGWLQARLVMVAYLLVAAVAFYVVARSVYGPAVALAALYLFVFRLEDDPFTSTLYLGRQVMGEVPALCFFLFGSLLWFLAQTGKKKGYVVGSGVLFGLAMVTKLQFVIWVPLALLVTAIVARFLLRERMTATVLTLAISLGCLGAWYVCLWAILGPTNLAALLRDLGAASSPQVRVFSPAAIQSGVKFLLRSEFLLFGLPGLVYALLQYGKPTPASVRALFLAVFIGIGLTWYVLASVGWPRYTYPFLAVGNVFIAKLLGDLSGGFRLPFHTLWEGLKRQQAARSASMPGLQSMAADNNLAERFSGGARGLAVLLILLVLPLGSFRFIAKDLFARPDDSLQRFSESVQTWVPPDAVIEMWEWEVALLDTEHRYHFPPTSLLNTLIAHVNLSLPYSPEDYNFQQFEPDYLIVGRFARWTGLYPQEFLENHCRRIVTIGEYELFEVTAR